MHFGRKLVSALMLLALLMPLVSVAMCAPASSAKMHCAPGCPMMAKRAAAHHQLSHTNGNGSLDRPSCCTVSKEKAAPSNTASPVSHNIALTVVALESVSTELISVRPGRTISSDAAPPPAHSAQSILCTFLI